MNKWLVVNYDNLNLCAQDPGKDIDIYIESTERALAEVWKGDVPL
jgi:hypothetical protein